MSKIYTDLNAVLTPYATAIKKNASDITSLNGSLDDLVNISYVGGSDIAVYATTSNYALKADGTYIADSNSEIKKYAVTAGDILYLSLSGDNAATYQFQNHVNLPTTPYQSSIVAGPFSGDVDAFVTVPNGATYLMVSKLKSNTTNVIKNATPKVDKIDSLDESVAGLRLASKSSADGLKWAYQNASNYVNALKNLDGRENGVYFSIYQDLDNVQSNYNMLTVKAMDTVTITLTAGGNIEDVTVLMGEDDISKKAYNATTHVITLNPVSGNVYIYARCKDDIVTDGLVYHWVASDYDNSGIWKDRVSGSEMTLVDVGKDRNKLSFVNASYGYADFDTSINEQTLEVVYNTTLVKSYGVVTTPKIGCICGSTRRLLACALPEEMPSALKEYILPKAGIHTDSLTYAGTLESSSFKAYYNGEEPTAYQGSANSYVTRRLTDKIGIGGIVNTSLDGIYGWTFTGDIYEVRIYNRVLTDAEVLKNLNHDNKHYYLNFGHPYDISDKLRLSADGTRVKLKVMSYNVGHWYAPNNLDDVLDEAFDTQNADIIGLQETPTATRVRSISQSGLLRGYGYCYYKICDKAQGTQGQLNPHAVASKLFCLGMTDVAYTDRYNECRQYSKSYIKVGNKTIALYNTHLEAYGTGVKYTQLQELMDDLATEEYFILLGDFNTACYDIEHEDYINMIKPLIDAGYNVANCNPDRDGFITTWNFGGDRTEPADNIVTSSNIKMGKVYVDDYKYTAGHTQDIDHFPLIAELEIPLV